jgi:hypothetical protein
MLRTISWNITNFLNFEFYYIDKFRKKISCVTFFHSEYFVTKLASDPEPDHGPARGSSKNFFGVNYFRKCCIKKNPCHMTVLVINQIFLNAKIFPQEVRQTCIQVRVRSGHFGKSYPVQKLSADQQRRSSLYDINENCLFFSQSILPIFL